MRSYSLLVRSSSLAPIRRFSEESPRYASPPSPNAGDRRLAPVRPLYSQRTVLSSGSCARRSALNASQLRTTASGRDRLRTRKSDSGG